MPAMNSTQHHGLVKVRGGIRRIGRLFPSVFLTALALVCLAFSAAAAGLPACLPPVAAGGAKVIGAQDNGVLALENGRTVKLEGLLWPGEADGAPEDVHRQTLSGLKQLVLGRSLILQTRAPRLDRYGRLRIQAVLPDGRWVQREMLRLGLARVSIPPDRRECARELYAAEAEARSARTGLWAVAAYAIRAPESLRWRDLGTFQIVEGKVVSAKVSAGRAYLDFGRNWRTDFTVTIAPEDMKTFRHAGVDPYSYAGKIVRVRGYIDRLHGFEIDAASPEAIEVLK